MITIMLVSSAIVYLIVYIVALNRATSLAPAPHYMFRLIHAMNVYSIPGKDNTTASTSPFDQWSAIESIKRARQYAPPDLHIDFVCAVFESDRAALSDLPCWMVSLTRSTKTEYQFIEDAKELPFIQDIIDAAIAQDKERNVDFFLLLTNSDIGLTKYFYPTIMPHLRIREAVSINHLTVSAEAIDMTNDKDALLSQVDSALEDANNHPGLDCFTIYSSVLQRIRLGDMFAGYPPWRNVMHRLLMLTADNYINVKSSINGTFHIGDDRKWSGNDWSEDKLVSYLEFEELMLLPTAYGTVNQQMMPPYAKLPTLLQHAPTAVSKKCPWGIGNSVYAWENDLNCAIGFQCYRYHNNRTIPRFIQPGFEGYCKAACNPWGIQLRPRKRGNH